MSVLVEMFYDFLIGVFRKLAEKKPGRSTWVRIGALILGIGAILAYFIHYFWLS